MYNLTILKETEILAYVFWEVKLKFRLCFQDFRSVYVVFIGQILSVF